MLRTAPDPKDVQDLQFKLQTRFKVFDPIKPNEAFSQHVSLVATASRFGLMFVGADNSTIQAIEIKNINTSSVTDGTKKNYRRRSLNLPSKATHISVNCEHTIVGIIVEIEQCPWVLFYDVKSFYRTEIVQITKVRLSATPNTTVKEVNWNPSLSSVFTACKSDGSLGIYELNNSGVDINELPPMSGATCFCWSPKGKQIAVGSKDGKITQLKPDLKAVKVISAPPFNDKLSILTLQWISNYQFIGVYQANNVNDQIVFVVVDAPKTGDPVFTNFDDICYSNGSTRKSQSYMIFLQNWNILLGASSNSMEVGVLGLENDCWTQWIMGDACRAELPLSSNHQDTLPIGMALDIGNTQALPWGESALPPTPRLLVLSHYGVLCCFNIVNLKPGIPTLCSPPESITDTSGLHLYVDTEIGTIVPLPKIETIIKPMGTPISDLISKSNTFQSKPVQSTITSQPQTMNLFGGQSSLIPLSQNEPVTPPMQQKASPAILSKLKDKIESKFPAQVNVQAISSEPSLLSKPTVVITHTPIQQKQNAPMLSTELSKADDLLQIEEESEQIFEQLSKEECLYLEAELRAILCQGRQIDFNLGMDSEKLKIVKNSMHLDEFCREVMETCVSQNSEVHILKQNLLQSWAWWEEAKSRHYTYEDESLKILLKTQPLDSASEKQLADLQHTDYYIKSQVSQAHRGLDEQWDSFQDYCRKTHKIQIPTMEMIFQTLVKHNAILRKQSYVLKDLTNRLKKKPRVNVSSLLCIDGLNSIRQGLTQLKLDPDDCYQLQYNHVTNRMKNLTPKKINSMRSFLKTREFPHISAIKPQLSSSIIQASPHAKLKQQSWSVSSEKNSTIKGSISKKLDFAQSTPKLQETKTIPVAIQTSIDKLEGFTLKFEPQTNTKDTEKIFTPLVNSSISSSSKSAFVSTSINTSTLSTTIPLKPTLTFTATNTFPIKKSLSTPVLVTTVSQGNIIQPQISTTSSTSFSILTPTVSNQSMGSSFNLSTKSIELTEKPVNSCSPLVADVSNIQVIKSPQISDALFSNKSSAISSAVNFSNKIVSTAPTSTGDLTKTQSMAAVISIPSTSSFNFSKNTKLPDGSGPFTGFVFSSKSDSAGASVSSPSVFNSKFVTTPNVPKSTALFTSTTSTPSLSYSTGITTSNFSFTSTQPGFPVSSTTKSTFVFDAAKTPVTTSTSTIVTVPSVTGTSISSATLTPISGASIFGSVPSTSSTPTISLSVTPNVAIPLISKAPVLDNSEITSSKSLTTIAAPSNKLNVVSASSVFTSTTPAPTSTFGTPQLELKTQSSTGTGFGSQVTSPSIFGSVQPTSPFFGKVTSTTTQPSIFATNLSTSQTFVTNEAPPFGSSVTTTSNKTSIFGGNVTTTASSPFGNSSQNSIFGNPPSTSSVFGNPASSSSVFGNSNTQKSIFGSSVTPTTTASIFRSQPTTMASVFGNASTTSTNSVFGASTTTSSSVFGQTPSTFGQPSAFGPSNSTVFGSSVTPSFGQSGTSVFGSSAVPTSTSAFSTSSVFGAPTTTAPSVFGGGSNVFSSNSNQSSPFGATPNPGSFGFGGLNVGATPNTSTSAFGTTPTTNPFATTPTKNIFGTSTAASSSTSLFGSTNTGSVFGTSTENFNNTFGNQSVFGQQSSFGQTSFGSGSFGQSPSGPFSAGSGSVQQSGFGTSSNFQKPGGFGSSPVFGGSPSFGTASTFGGNSSFGTVPAFSNSPKVFGASGGSFGTETNTQNAGFGNIANQQTVGFGNLAQKNNQPSNVSPFGGASSFSSWR